MSICLFVLKNLPFSEGIAFLSPFQGRFLMGLLPTHRLTCIPSTTRKPVKCMDFALEQTFKTSLEQRVTCPCTSCPTMQIWKDFQIEHRPKYAEEIPVDVSSL